MTARSALATIHRRVTFVPIRAQAREHELEAQRLIAARLADLLGCAFDAGHGATPAPPLGYAVPNDTLLSLEHAHSLGLRDEHDLFGGVVPFPFVATKAITHPLIAADARAPAGWQPRFAQQVRDVVLPGLSVFSFDEARAAALRLLARGPVRIKPAGGVGGLGQSVARDAAQCEQQLLALAEGGFDAGIATGGGAGALFDQGVVLETDLSQVRTYSVGLLRVGQLQAGYVGTQRTTRRRDGGEAYGGSTITLVRGDLQALEDSIAASDRPARCAVRQARVYHEAALDCFAGMFASRCNYDIVQGNDAAGVWRSGVLEQSWRIGGASGAELVAIEALCADPQLQQVSASTVEVHAQQAPVPEGAIVLFRGVDDELGPITKYATVHGDAG